MAEIFTVGLLSTCPDFLSIGEDLLSRKALGSAGKVDDSGGRVIGKPVWDLDLQSVFTSS